MTDKGYCPVGRQHLNFIKQAQPGIMTTACWLYSLLPDRPLLQVWLLAVHGAVLDPWPLWCRILSIISHFLLVLNSSTNFIIYCCKVTWTPVNEFSRNHSNSLSLLNKMREVSQSKQTTSNCLLTGKFTQ